MSSETQFVGHWRCDKDELRNLAEEQAKNDPSHMQGAALEQMLKVFSSLELELASDHTATMKIPAFDPEAKHGNWSYAAGEITITPSDADPGSPGEGGYTARTEADGRLMLIGPGGPPLPLVRA